MGLFYDPVVTHCQNQKIGYAFVLNLVHEFQSEL
jgi:hypothetical protein